MSSEVPKNPEEEVVDFSNYMNQNSADEPENPAPSPFQPLETKFKFSKQIYILFGILAVLIIIQMITILYMQSIRPQQVERSVNQPSSK